MKIVHLLAGGNIGGIETLCKDYVNYSKHENLIVILWDNGPLGKEMQKLGIKVVCLHASRKNALSIIRRVAKLCKDEKADALIAHHAAPISHLSLLYMKKYNRHLCTIAYAHGNANDMIRIQDKKGRWLRKLILKTSLKCADQVVAISKSVKDSLVNCFDTPKEKITVIYNGISLSRFNVPYKSNSGNTLRIIYVGRLIREKGVQSILKALTYLQPKEKYHLKIVGDGPYRTVLEAFVQEQGLTDMVDFLGSRRDIPELLSESDVFIHTPLWEEGLGITILEAMAEGKICICAKAGAIPEIITNGIDGFLIEKGNAEQLANTINTVVGMNNDKKQNISRNAKMRAKCFSDTIFVHNLDELIESAAKK